jgi:cystathionine beta-lyase/cystathionine gamma-synthase
MTTETLDPLNPSENFFSRLQTAAIHAGQAPDPATGALLTPIYQTTTYVQSAVGQDKGYTYSRSGNPTVAALERKLGELEGGLPATCYNTGLAATTALCLALLKAGDHVIASDVVYGGTVRLLRQVLAPFGVASSYVDGADPANISAALRPETRLIFIESPANPTLKLTDLAAAARIAKAAGALLCVDNTLLTPSLQSPLELGADLVLHSTTKYIEGHNATVGGAIVTRRPELQEPLKFTQNAIGAIQSPFNAFLTLQGSKTLPLRMERHSANALAVARFLESHPKIQSVAYPGLESFPQHALARQQQRAGGGLIAFEVKGGVEAGIRLMNSVRLCALAENLGAVETLITHPASMTHASVPAEQRTSAGITDSLVRLSVGLENPDDIIADLRRALEM